MYYCLLGEGLSGSDSTGDGRSLCLGKLDKVWANLGGHSSSSIGRTASILLNWSLVGLVAMLLASNAEGDSTVLLGDSNVLSSVGETGELVAVGSSPASVPKMLS